MKNFLANFINNYIFPIKHNKYDKITVEDIKTKAEIGDVILFSHDRATLIKVCSLSPWTHIGIISKIDPYVCIIECGPVRLLTNEGLIVHSKCVEVPAENRLIAYEGECLLIKLENKDKEKMLDIRNVLNNVFEEERRIYRDTCNSILDKTFMFNPVTFMLNYFGLTNNQKDERGAICTEVVCLFLEKADIMDKKDYAFKGSIPVHFVNNKIKLKKGYFYGKQYLLK